MAIASACDVRALLGMAPYVAGRPHGSAFLVSIGRAPEPDLRLPGLRFRDAGGHRPSAAVRAMFEKRLVLDHGVAPVASGIHLPFGTKAEFGGAAEAEEKAQKQLFLHSAIAAVGILLLLSIVLHNWRNLTLVLANLPFALVGGVLAVWLTSLFEPAEGSLTIGALVGFVTLFGITTRNSIMLISHYEHLVNAEGMVWGSEAAFRGASERLMPILMTAVVTALGLLPLALGSGEAGREIEGPMAMVILGGLITSTLLNLLVLPTLALRYGRFVKSESLPE